MVRNLPESFVYEKLPEAIITADERGLIAAVMGGTQDRLEDLRSYSRKLRYLLDPGALPDTGNNVVLADVLSDQGVVFTRSLELTEETPADGTSALYRWVMAELNLPAEKVSNVRYGRDLLRAVDADVLSYLADTVGAILHQTDLTGTAEYQRLVETYFPRLRIKGTARSFEVLGRALGFDDLIFSPLWGRVSPRQPDDPGNAVNDPDFAYAPEFWPSRVLGPLYDPNVMRDGLPYLWNGTVNHGTGSTEFYTQVVNGRNPYIKAIVLAVDYGTVAHPEAGAYALSGGAPHAKAYVDASTGIRFQAVAEGESWNGLEIQVSGSGSLRTLAVNDQLTSVKYRTSYFDLVIAADIDTAVDTFGSRNIQPNKYLVSGSNTVDGISVSPHRPWIDGSIATGSLAQDWVTQTVSNGSVVVSARTQAPSIYDELVYGEVLTAAAQVVEAMEEVRPASRFLRRAGPGLLIREQVPYACYQWQADLFTTDGTNTAYNGSSAYTPLGDYWAEVVVKLPPTVKISWASNEGQLYEVRARETIISPETVVATPVGLAGTTSFYDAIVGTYAFYFVYDSLSGTEVNASISSDPDAQFTAYAEVDPVSGTLAYYSYNNPDVTNLQLSGTYDFGNGSYAFSFAALASGPATVVAQWTLTDTEIIRPEPDFAAKFAGSTACQIRPEDEEGEVLDEVVDDYPWLRAPVGGGELVEASMAYPETSLVGVEEVSESAVVTDQTGAGHVLYVRTSSTGHHRFISDVSPTDDQYQPGSVAVGYRGTFRDLSSYSAAQHALVNAYTDLEVQFEPGFSVYKVGMVYGVPVADPERFYAPAVRDNWVAWLPCNEHAEDNLSVREAMGLAATVSGLDFSDRVYDVSKGWVLQPRTGFALALDLPIESDLTVGFWIKVEPSGVGSSTVVEAGPVSFDVNHGSGAVTAYARQAAGSRIAIATALATDWTYVSLSLTAEQAAGMGSTVIDTFETGSDGLSVQGAGCLYQLHDLRVWNAAKDSEAIAKVSGFEPEPTAVNYPLSWVASIQRTDHYGLFVLPNGWLEPAQLPAWLRRTAQQRVLRYLSNGSYAGISAYREVGLGGGITPPSVFSVDGYPLGYAFPYPTAGTVVFSGSHGLLPGENALWRAANVPGAYLALTGGYTANGSIAVATAAPSVPWPNNQTQTNPARETIWLADKYGVAVYEARLTGLTGTEWLVAERVGFGRSQADIRLNPIYSALLTTGTYDVPPFNGTQPLVDGVPVGPAVINGSITYLGSLSLQEQVTGAEVQLINGGRIVTVLPQGDTVGSVIQEVTGNTDSTPPAWMYLRQRTIEDVPNAWTRWLSNDVSSAYGNDIAAHPEVPVPVAALDENGYLDFQHISTLVPGVYKLHIESGNIGMPDADFDGFRVEVSINNTLVEARLLQGRTGYNVRGWDTLEFHLPVATTGDWILNVTWTNAYTDASRGVQRRLVVYSYRLERVVNELFLVHANPSGSKPLITPYVTVPGTFSGTVPGGWLRAVTSAGTLTGQSHESVVPASSLEDTLYLSGVLTGCTAERRQDVIVSAVSGTTVPPEDAPLVFPSFGSVVSSTLPTNLTPFWVWSSGINNNTGFTVSAKMRSDCRVRLVVGTGSSLSNPVYSDYVYSSKAVNNNVVKLTVSGLEPWTSYRYGFEVEDIPPSVAVGYTHTFDTNQRSFTFALGSCVNNVRGAAINTPIWTYLMYKVPLFFLQTGDLHYNNIAVNDPNYFRDAFDAIFLQGTQYTFLTPPSANSGSTGQRVLWQDFPVVYMWDDHDYGPDDSDTTNPAREAARFVYREYCPHYPLPGGSGAIYFTFRVGRCVFVVTDNRSERSPKGNTDNANKIVWSAAQKAWFKAQVLTASRDPDVQAIFWVNTFPWIGAASAGADYWAGYSTARQELVDWFAAEGITRLFILSGDMHAMAIDDGRNSPGGIPVFQAGPLYQTSSHKGGPYMIGPTPAAGIANTTQFGIVSVNDYGTRTDVTFSGYDQFGVLLTTSGTNVQWTLDTTASPY